MNTAIDIAEVPISHVVGKEGATIEEIQNGTGAKLEIIDATKVKITGKNEEHVSTAEKKVHDIIANQENQDVDGPNGERVREEINALGAKYSNLLDEATANQYGGDHATSNELVEEAAVAAAQLNDALTNEKEEDEEERKDEEEEGESDDKDYTEAHLVPEGESETDDILTSIPAEKRLSDADTSAHDTQSVTAADTAADAERSPSKEEVKQAEEEREEEEAQQAEEEKEEEVQQAEEEREDEEVQQAEEEREDEEVQQAEEEKEEEEAAQPEEDYVRFSHAYSAAENLEGRNTAEPRQSVLLQHRMPECVRERVRLSQLNRYHELGDEEAHQEEEHPQKAEPPIENQENENEVYKQSNNIDKTEKQNEEKNPVESKGQEGVSGATNTEAEEIFPANNEANAVPIDNKEKVKTATAAAPEKEIKKDNKMEAKPSLKDDRKGKNQDKGKDSKKKDVNEKCCVSM